MEPQKKNFKIVSDKKSASCLLYTTDAADE